MQYFGIEVPTRPVRFDYDHQQAVIHIGAKLFPGPFKPADAETLWKVPHGGEADMLRIFEAINRHHVDRQEKHNEGEN